MTEQVPINEAGARLGSLVARTAQSRVTITEHGEPAAVLIDPRELAELEEGVALADYRAQQAAGTLRTVSQDEVRDRLGLPRE